MLDKESVLGKWGVSGTQSSFELNDMRCAAHAKGKGAGQGGRKRTMNTTTVVSRLQTAPSIFPRTFRYLLNAGFMIKHLAQHVVHLG